VRWKAKEDHSHCNVRAIAPDCISKARIAPPHGASHFGGVRTLWLHPNKGLELLESKVDKIPTNTIGASGGQIFLKRTLGDSDTSQAGALCGAKACRASRTRSILK
jgi:hypothetical protein